MGILRNGGRQHIFKGFFPHIPLGLHTEGRNAMTGDLGQQRTGDTFDGKGEAGVLHRAFVTNLRQHIDEILGFFLVQPLPNGVRTGGGIAHPGRGGHQLFRLGRMRKQSHFWRHIILPP